MGMGTEGTLPLAQSSAPSSLSMLTMPFFRGHRLTDPKPQQGGRHRPFAGAQKRTQGYATLISWLGKSDRDGQGTCPEPLQHSPAALSTNLEVSLQRRGSPLGDASSNHRSGVNHGSFLRAGEQGQAGEGRTPGAAGSWGRLPASPQVTALKELGTSTQQHALPVPAPSLQV